MTAAGIPVASPASAAGRDVRRLVARTPPAIEDLAFVIALAITLVVVSTIHYFPYQDATNNLTRYVLMDRAWFGTPAPFVSVRLIPTPYIALDLLGVALVHVLGPHAALRAMTCILIAVIPVGMYLLLRATCPARRGWAIVGVLCGVSFYLMIGFFNFVAGTGAALIWLAAWWPRRHTTSRRSRLGLMLGLIVVFLIHLAGVMTVLVVLGVSYLVTQWDRRAARGGRLVPPARDLWTPELATFVLAAATVALMFVIWRRSLGSEPPAAGVPPVFRSPFNKLANLGSPFYGLGFVQMAVMGTGYAASLITFLAINRRTLRLDPMIASAIAFGAIFMVFPYSIDGAGYVDMRWLLPAILLPFCATATGPVPAQRPALAVPFVATLLHIGVVRRQAAQIDAQLTVYHRVLQLVPPDARLLPLVTARDYRGRASPYRHFAFWHTIERGGQVPGILSEEDRYDTNPPSRPHKFFGHFREPVNPYYPDERWGTQMMFPLDWRRIDNDYDYIVQAGRNPEAEAVIASNADLVARAGDIALFRVRTARSAQRVARSAAAAVAAVGIVATAAPGPTAAPGLPVDPPPARVTDVPSAPTTPAASHWRLGVHPGGFFTERQLNYVLQHIRAGQQPWAAAFDQLMASATRLKSWQPHPIAVYNVPGFYQNRDAFFAATNALTHDVDAAYVNAVAYRLTGDGSYADCAARILRAWARTNTAVSDSGDSKLSMAEVGVGMVLSGELLTGYSGWSAADRDALRNWTRTVYLPQGVNPIKDRKNNWGDWGTFGAVTADYYLDDAAGFADETARMQRHIDEALAPDGHMPDETARGEAGIWYSYFALAPMTAAAHVIRYGGGPDLFRWSSPTGKRLKNGLDYLLDGVQNPDHWPHAPRVSVPNPNKDWWPYDVYEAMSDEYGDQRFADYAAQRRPIMNTGHHHAWTFPTLMKAPPDAY